MLMKLFDVIPKGCIPSIYEEIKPPNKQAERFVKSYSFIKPVVKGNQQIQNDDAN